MTGRFRNAFTGGGVTVEEQRRLGATPEICSVWALWRTKFARSDAEFESVTRDCRSGAMLCGECKSKVAERVHEFLAEHAERRERVRAWAESAIIERPPPAVSYVHGPGPATVRHHGAPGQPAGSLGGLARFRPRAPSGGGASA